MGETPAAFGEVDSQYGNRQDPSGKNRPSNGTSIRHGPSASSRLSSLHSLSSITRLADLEDVE